MFKTQIQLAQNIMFAFWGGFFGIYGRSLNDESINILLRVTEAVERHRKLWGMSKVNNHCLQ